MNRPLTFILISIFIGLLLLGGWFVFQHLQKKKAAEQAGYKPAPEFALTSFEDADVTNIDFSGRKQVVMLWASWDHYSDKELPMYEQLHATYGDSLVVLAINRAEDEAIAERFLADHNIDEVIVLKNPDDSYFKSVDGRAAPITLFIDENDIVIFQKNGPYNTYAALESDVRHHFGL